MTDPFDDLRKKYENGFKGINREDIVRYATQDAVACMRQEMLAHLERSRIDLLIQQIHAYAQQNGLAAGDDIRSQGFKRWCGLQKLEIVHATGQEQHSLIRINDKDIGAMSLTVVKNERGEAMGMQWVWITIEALKRMLDDRDRKTQM